MQTAGLDGCGALLVSDELDDLRIAHRVLVMFKGEVVAEFPSGWTDSELIAAVEGLAGRDAENHELENPGLQGNSEGSATHE